MMLLDPNFSRLLIESYNYLSRRRIFSLSAASVVRESIAAAILASCVSYIYLLSHTACY